MTHTLQRTVVRVLSGPFSGQFGTVTDTIEGGGPTYLRVLLQSNVATVLHPSQVAVFER